MKILFIRHGETTDNLRHVYAGVTDSSLTSHGVLQTARLATHIGTTIPPLTHIFSSPLSRAKKTAEAIYEEQKKVRVSQKRSKQASAGQADEEEGKGKDSAADIPETATSSSTSINPILSEDERAIEYDDEEEEAGEAIFFKIDADLIEQDFGSYEGEQFLTATPKKNLKKRKRSDSVGSGPGGSGGSAAGGSGGDSKKRKSDDNDLSTTTGATTTTTDVEMTAGEEGPLTGSTDTPLAAAAIPLPEEEEEEEEEEFREMETPASIKARADSFIRRCVIPLLPGTPILLPPSLASHNATTGNSQDPPPENSSPVVAIVSHSMLLSWLWKSFVALFPPSSVLATTPVVQKGWYQGKHPGWGNTGYLVVEVLPKGVVNKDGMTVVIEGVNEKAHLVGLRRTGGGVGSEKWDERQSKLDGFFGKKEK
ncbi:hypothetical protein TWF718_007590 [Orbilia javanica]|uniref:Phosphoglycerate mutase-like protein n=1 Tax=Orbilia javanica TaxID=47235 RepID=A0AAN8MZP8_9PEZI